MVILRVMNHFRANQIGKSNLMTKKRTGVTQPSSGSNLPRSIVRWPDHSRSQNTLKSGSPGLLCLLTPDFMSRRVTKLKSDISFPLPVQLRSYCLQVQKKNLPPFSLIQLMHNNIFILLIFFFTFFIMLLSVQKLML